MEQILRTRIEVGLPEPVKLLHITDVHLTKFGDRDSLEHRKLLPSRYDTFNEAPLDPEDYFREAIAMAEEMGTVLVVTGDVIDLHNPGNIEAFHAIAHGHDMMFTPGGHEHQCRFVRTMEEGWDYVQRVRTQLTEEFPEFDLDFDSRVIGGVNVVTADNSLDYFNAQTVCRFEKELQKGLPMILFCHDPLNDPLIGRTEPYHPNISLTPEDYRVSNSMLDKLLHDPRVITTVAGHAHVSREYEIDGKTHYITDGLFRGVCRLIELV